MVNLWCLHGNLQVPSAWDPIEETFLQEHLADATAVKFRKIEVWDLRADSINHWVSLFFDNLNNLREKASEHWLMGYSLGGRLALHALLKRPDLWKGAIIIAAHPGLEGRTDRVEQCKRDKIWAERFRIESWNDLIEEWNRLPVFGKRPNPLSLKEGVVSRDSIAQAFNVFSKGRQEYLVPHLKKIKDIPVLYIAGREDVKYTKIGMELTTECPAVTLTVIDGACHRVPWENKERFVEVVQQFIAKNG